MDFHRFCSETRCQIILDVPKTPSPPLTEKLDRLMDCTLCVFGGLSMYLCTVYRHIIQMKFLNNEILKLSSKFKILQISSIPVYLSQDHVTDVLIRFGIFFGFPGWWHLLNLSGWWTETHLTQLDDVLSQVLHIFFWGWNFSDETP